MASGSFYIQQKANGEDISVSGDFINVTNKKNKMLWMVMMIVINSTWKWPYNDTNEHMSERRIAAKL